MTARHTSRRAILAGAMTMPLAAAVASSPALADGDDAELLRLSVKLEAMEKEWIEVTVPDLANLRAHMAGKPEPFVVHMTDDDNDAFTDRLFAMVYEIEGRPAATLAGIAVLARTAVLANATQWVNGAGDERDRRFIETVCAFLGITPITDIALAAVEGAVAVAPSAVRT
jgi:hypothetical protein